MSDLNAIRARHVPIAFGPEDGETNPDRRWCDFDGAEWPCDTAIVLAALDLSDRQLSNAAVGYVEVKREYDAALARERRLADFRDEALAWIDIRAEYPDDYSDARLERAEKRWQKARAALAEMPEAGS